MLQPEELRLGNWMINGNTKTREYVQFTDSMFQWFRQPRMGKHPSGLEPIPLTPEILEKAGFVWSIYHQAFHFGDSLVNEFYDLAECFPKGYQLSTFKKTQTVGQPFFYLHQLQNLYFALTGEELPINL